jgi:uroporphyrinogen III methyltransferase/synthase
VETARTHRTVVRLKGGDPFVFGRGGEEALALHQAGIRFDIVPGVTAAVGVSAYAGIPLTHRDFASSVTFVTGHEGRGDSRIDWAALAALKSTLAIYMGVGGLERISRALIDGGRSAETPAAVIEWGTHARQRTVTAALGEIAEAARAARLGAPALVVIGEVAALREQLAWFDRLPLRGKRIVVGRSRPQPSRIAKALAALGADVQEHPKLRSEPVGKSPAVDQLFAQLPTASWLLFTSPAAVTEFRAHADARNLDARCVARLRIASLGAATTRALRGFGIRPDLSTRTFDETRVIEGMGGFGALSGATVLFPREGHLHSHVAASLRSSGARVIETEIFRTVAETCDEAAVAEMIATADAVVLPSSTSAAAIAAVLGGRHLGGDVVAIGPRTAETAAALGLDPSAIAGSHTVDGVADLILALLGQPLRTRLPELAGAPGIAPTLS